jgi:hypothetical protein
MSRMIRPMYWICREAARLHDRLAQVVRHLDARELLGRERHQLGAHVLQVAHLLLAPGLADKIVFFHSSTAPGCA